MIQTIQVFFFGVFISKFSYFDFSIKFFFLFNIQVTVSPQIPLDIAQPNARYQMSVEINSGLTMSTLEIDQYYDGELNRGVNIIRDNGKQFNIYTYDQTNEVITVSGAK